MPITLEEAQALKVASTVRIVRNPHLFFVKEIRCWEERRRQKVYIGLVSDDGKTETWVDETRLWAVSLADREPEVELVGEIAAPAKATKKKNGKKAKAAKK